MDCPTLPWMINFHSTHDGKIMNQQYTAAYAKDYLTHLCDINVDSQMPKKRLCGIICSIGLNATTNMLEELMAAGMTVAVIKLAHCNLEEAKELHETIRKAVMNYSMTLGRVFSLGIGIDIKGPEVRVGKINTVENDGSKELELVEGEMTKLTNDPMYEEFVTKDMIYVNIKDINNVVPGDKIHISDTNNGQISLSAERIVGSIIRCLIENTGRITDRASVSLEAAMNIPLLSEEDKEAIEFAASEKVSFVFIPYADQPDTLREVRKRLGKEGRATLIVAKIENVAGVYNIDALLEVADAILISRNALASEMTPEKVVLVQKMIIGKCCRAGVPSIVAPSVLLTMTQNAIPTNSEIGDISSAITDGVDCLMLSREITTGTHPVEAVRALDTICRSAESLMYQTQLFHDLCQTTNPVEPLHAISIAAVEASMKCNAAAILVATVTGRSAKLITKCKPRCPVIAITRYAHISKSLNIWRGIDPVLYIKKPEEVWSKDLEKRIQFGLTHGKRSGYIRAGDALVIVMGTRMGTGFTNSLKIVYASEFDTYG